MTKRMMDSSPLVKEVLRIAKKDHVGIVTSRMIEQKFRRSAEEIRLEFEKAGYEIDPTDDWYESIREGMALDRVDDFLKAQDYWLKKNERGFEFVAERAHKAYRDFGQQTDVLKVQLTRVEEDDNVEIE